VHLVADRWSGCRLLSRHARYLGLLDVSRGLDGRPLSKSQPLPCIVPHSTCATVSPRHFGAFGSERRDPPEAPIVGQHALNAGTTRRPRRIVTAPPCAVPPWREWPAGLPWPRGSNGTSPVVSADFARLEFRSRVRQTCADTSHAELSGVAEVITAHGENRATVSVGSQIWMAARCPIGVPQRIDAALRL